MASEAARRIYDTRQWRRVRVLVLERDGYVCAECRGHADTVDHDPDIETLINIGADPYDTAYLRSMCRVCHGARDGVRSSGMWKPKLLEKKPNPFDNWLDAEE